MTSAEDWLQQDSRLARAGWRHGWTTSHGPNFRGDPAAADHAASIGELVRAAGLKEGAWAHQVHGGRVLEVSAGGFAGDADALWTARAGLGVIGRSADCPLILVGGTREDGSRIWGFAHASWRSTLQGISTGLILALKDNGAELSSLQAVICPSAGPCCYEVGTEVREAALASLGSEAAWFFVEKSPAIYFDLWAANTFQLTGAGVPEDRIGNVQHCTICGGEIFPSFRRDGDLAGRFAAIIGS
jgi:YfiH family protein